MTFRWTDKHRVRISRIKSVLFKLVMLAVVSNLGCAGSKNILKNPDGDKGIRHWTGYGDSIIEQSSDGNNYFVVRNHGHFFQDIIISENVAGQHALLIGEVSSERINSDGGITGLPYLYGYMVNSANPLEGRIIAYLQGQSMLFYGNKPNEWVPVWGIFKILPDTRAIRFFLSQAERKGVPQNGSAARFDNLGLYIFPTEDEAMAFVKKYKLQR